MASISCLNVNKTDKNFLLSPITIALEMNFNSSLISFSINTGATFSPPAVINNSFNLPVIYKLPFLSNFPISPECK